MYPFIKETFHLLLYYKFTAGSATGTEYVNVLCYAAVLEAYLKMRICTLAFNTCLSNIEICATPCYLVNVQKKSGFKQLMLTFTANSCLFTHPADTKVH